MGLPQAMRDELDAIKAWVEKGRKEYKGGEKYFHHLGHLRTDTLPHKTDQEIGDRVRMLMRDDLDHEGVCQAARNRIFHLSERVNAYDKAAREVARYKDADETIPHAVWQRLYDVIEGSIDA